MKISNIDIDFWNKELKYKSPGEIVDWALPLTKKRIVTTSFGKYSAILLKALTNKDKSIDVIWCDTGYNKSDTYAHAIQLIDMLKLNIHMYAPLQSSAYTDITLGIPDINDIRHEKFTEIVKLEPFRRAITEHQPDVWFTNIRVRQSEYRNSKDILSVSKSGVLKISPFYYWTDNELDDYLKLHNLPKNNSYFDPTKVLNNRECGIHLQ